MVQQKQRSGMFWMARVESGQVRLGRIGRARQGRETIGIYNCVEREVEVTRTFYHFVIWTDILDNLSLWKLSWIIRKIITIYLIKVGWVAC